ncbi:putative beta-alanine synthase [Cercophora newfieldiana]|uniref:Beta-alanine synthase n=1 Tax=Cercophora newfieldiana TaxID=92897 RepID=A0AA39XT65_9PEZI|nr:putative beta-alanine synthase [Cercophora newfieldiana]
MAMASPHRILSRHHRIPFKFILTRSFSTSTSRPQNVPHLRTYDPHTSLSSLRVNPSRLLNTLHHTSQWGTGHRYGAHPTETGMSRLALSDSDKSARDWFVETTKALGCEVSVDEMGNIFAVRKGREGTEGKAATFVGSHLDTQPRGGRYDGVLGVVGGVEMLRVLEEGGAETGFPVGVVNWTNEEGARFPISMVSSGVWAGEIPLEKAHGLKEVGGGTATMRGELERIGYLGEMPASHEAMPMAAHFELHIEQGPILEKEERKIGIVKGVQAYRWFTVEVVGQEAHTGTTPFNARADPLLAASWMICLSNRAAASFDGALASTGILTLEPGSVNTIPGKVKFSLDIRAPTDKTLDMLEKHLRSDFDNVVADATRNGQEMSVTWQTDSVSSAVYFHDSCIKAVRDSATAVLGDENLAREMTSGAGHDSVYASRRCPTSMIFVPSRKGISHNPKEYTSPEDCAIGADVLMQSVLRFDRQRVATEG